MQQTAHRDAVAAETDELQVHGAPVGEMREAFQHQDGRTARRLEFGGEHVNEGSSAGVDIRPIGGVTYSGSGREGPGYAIREMTEERLVTLAY